MSGREPPATSRSWLTALSMICRNVMYSAWIVAGLVLGILETFLGGIPWLSSYRDGIAFAILILILLFKPAGLLGKATVEKV